ncbi:MAG: prolyl oligopeptidase family serine peptidase [Chthoniobacterales bacterium]
MKLKIAAIVFLLASTALAQTPKHPFTFEDMMKLKRVSAPVASPNGKWVVFDAEDVDLEANTKTAHLWIVAAIGGESRRLNPTPTHEERPRFSPDGKRLIWTSKATEPSQIWMCDFEPDSGTLVGKPHQVTNMSTGADGGVWSPDGKNIVFISSVYPGCGNDDCNKRREEELKNSKVKAKVFSHLFYRHWNAFSEFKRSHLFVVSAELGTVSGSTESRATTNGGEPRDLTPGDHDVPPFNLGGQDMYVISPDGQELAYTSNIDEIEAASTNNDIFVVPIAGGTPNKISTSPGSDSTPLYSPSGKYLAWRSQARAGFESDKQSLLIFDRAAGKLTDVTKNFDRSVGSFTWTLPEPPRGNKPITPLIFTAEDHGQSPVYVVDIGGDESPVRGEDLHADDLVFAGSTSGLGTLYFTRMSISSPNEIWRMQFPSPEGRPSAEAVTHLNDTTLNAIDMAGLESFTFKGAADEDVQGFMVKPPRFDPAKKYPLKFLIHGGPQGSWGNDWSYRWNPELFAANGYVVVMINFHGSTGYGQKFTDSISGDWGGKPSVDLMKGLDYVEKTYPFIDANREAALGASYGGFMANWLLGHTDRFKCIVSHDGMFNTESAYGTTEEIWFPEWEFKGPPWKQRELYRKWSPHLSADKFKTPTLVVHGQLDYRFDVSEGFQLFTTLQRLSIPSKMLYFPDEGHWVLKPQNGRLWYQTVNDWIDQWCKAH